MTNFDTLTITSVTLPTPQVDVLKLSGTVETGDVYRVTVNGFTLNYTVPGGVTFGDVDITGLGAATARQCSSPSKTLA